MGWNVSFDVHVATSPNLCLYLCCPNTTSAHDYPWSVVPRLFPVPLDCGVQITASTSFAFSQIAPRGRPRSLTSHQSLTTGMTTGSRLIQLMLGISLPQVQDWVGYITAFTTFQAKMLDVVAGTGGIAARVRVCKDVQICGRPNVLSLCQGRRSRR